MRLCFLREPILFSGESFSFVGDDFFAGLPNVVTLLIGDRIAIFVLPSAYGDLKSPSPRRSSAVVA